jgi:D-sedoheptulose 7-phosphate isomerase
MVSDFLDQYSNTINQCLKKLSKNELEQSYKLIEKTIKNKKKIFVCGNGGSAAISNHFICDYLKLIRHNTKHKPKIISLSNNIETISAIANDYSYDDIFLYQAESLFEKGDIFIIISASGNSKNILKLAKWCKQNKIRTINLIGFDGGKLKNFSKINNISKIKNYGAVEDTHHILMHVFMQYFILKNKNKKLVRI